MRILWFSHSPSLALQALQPGFNVGRSWIESLDLGMKEQKDIQLGVAFNWLVDEVQEIKIEGHPTEYYAMPRYPKSKWARFYQRWTCQPEPFEKHLPHFLEVVERFRPDVVHFFGTESMFPLLIPQLKVPAAIWVQGNLTVYHTKWEVSFPIGKTLRYERWKDILNAETYLHHYRLMGRKAAREASIFRYAQYFTGRTKWDRRLVATMAPQAQYFHCEEAMRPVFFQHQWQLHRHRDHFVMVTTISDNLYKGLDLVMETTMLLQSLVNKRVEWRVVGIAEDNTYVRMCRDKANCPTSNGLVKMLGFQPAERLAEELMNADLYVHPSHIENSPNSICEAMLMGVPVVSTNVGGTPELLVNKEEGLLVHCGDAYAMAGAILECYHAPERAANMGQRARRRGLQRNDLNAIVSSLLEIYNKMLTPNKKPHGSPSLKPAESKLKP
ncbi:MAG: glycosyltransferase family 4 protein [Bacteroidota bacterium]